MKIGTRLILLFVGITFLSTGFVALSITHGVRTALREVIGDNYRDQAAEGASNIEILLRERIHEAEQLAARAPVLAAVRAANTGYEGRSEADIAARIHTVDEAWIAAKGQSAAAVQVGGSEVSRFLRQWTIAAPSRYGEIFVTDRRGAAIGMTGKLSDYDQADEQWWSEAFADGRGAVFLDDRGLDETTDTVVIGVVVPVRDGDRVVGILKVNYNIDKLFALPLADRLSEGGRTFLARASGQVIAATGAGVVPTIREAEIAAMRARRTGWVEEQDSTIWRLRAHAPVSLTIHSRTLVEGGRPGISGERWEPVGWHVFFEVPSEVAFAPITALQWLAGVVAVITLFLAVLVAVATARAFSRPLQALRSGAERIAGGELTYRLTVESGDEIGELASAFNRMAGALETQIASLREREELLRLQGAALESTANAIDITDHEGTIQWVNRAFCELTGYTTEEAVGRNPRFLKSGVHDAAFYRRMYETILAGSTWRGEIVNRYKDGRFGAEEMIITPMRGEDGAITHFIAIKVDITERKRIEREIRELNVSLERRVAERTAQLEEASRAKSDFLANMSHELRTPLNAIIGFSEMMKDGLLGALDAKQRGFVADIFNAGTHLLALVNDILDLSKVEAGMTKLEPVALDVAALLKSSTLIVREKAAAHRIRLETEFDPALGTVLADERKVKQIAYNLLSNAVKFTPDGGTVTLSARRCARAGVAIEGDMPARVLRLAPGEAGEFVEISVSDTGIGIAEEDLPKLFEPFTQVDSSPARREGGTGLGLSMVKRLAELHGGTVGVASRQGVGSAFSVWLPYRAAVPATPERPAVPEDRAPSAPGTPLALVVEDDDRVAELIATQLRAEGFETMRAATAEEGLVRAAKRKPQLVTLDIFLPEMDGWEFMRRLKADPKLADTPVVIITVSPQAERGLALGARRILQKPFMREQLVEALAGLVEHRPNGDPARVLVVDDNVKAVELVATVLEAEGCRVMRAYGGAEAIEVARRARPDLVILDLLMPEVSGFEVAKALRESEQTAHVPILVLTAKDLTAEDRARLNGDVSAILQKSSFSTGDLRAELRRALPRRGGEQEG